MIEALLLVFGVAAGSLVWWFSRHRRRLPPSPGIPLPFLGHLQMLGVSDPREVFASMRWATSAIGLFLARIFLTEVSRILPMRLLYLSLSPQEIALEGNDVTLLTGKSVEKSYCRQKNNVQITLKLISFTILCVISPNTCFCMTKNISLWQINLSKEDVD